MVRLNAGIKRSLWVTPLMTVAILAAFAGWAWFRFGSIEHALAYARGERLFVEHPSRSLGAVEAGRLYRVDFRLSNDSDQPIRVVGFRSSCGCTTMSDLPMLIPPADMRSITVRLNPSASSLVSDSQLRVYTDHPPKPELSLRLIANIIPSKH